MEMKTHFHNTHPEVARSFQSDLKRTWGGGKGGSIKLGRKWIYKFQLVQILDREHGAMEPVSLSVFNFSVIFRVETILKFRVSGFKFCTPAPNKWLPSDLTWQVKMGRIKTVNSIPNLCLSIEFKAFKGKISHLHVWFSFSLIIAFLKERKEK